MLEKDCVSMIVMVAFSRAIKYMKHSLIKTIIFLIGSFFAIAIFSGFEGRKSIFLLKVNETKKYKFIVKAVLRYRIDKLLSSVYINNPYPDAFFQLLFI